VQHSVHRQPRRRGAFLVLQRTRQACFSCPRRLETAIVFSLSWPPVSAVGDSSILPNALQTDENELRSIFGTQPGFRQIKLNRGARGITCFVEFTDVASAMTVHQSQQVSKASHNSNAEHGTQGARLHVQ